MADHANAAAPHSFETIINLIQSSIGCLARYALGLGRLAARHVNRCDLLPASVFNLSGSHHHRDQYATAAEAQHQSFTFGFQMEDDAVLVPQPQITAASGRGADALFYLCALESASRFRERLQTLGASGQSRTGEIGLIPRDRIPQASLPADHPGHGRWPLMRNGSRDLAIQVPSRDCDNKGRVRRTNLFHERVDRFTERVAAQFGAPCASASGRHQKADQSVAGADVADMPSAIIAALAHALRLPRGGCHMGSSEPMLKWLYDIFNDDYATNFTLVER